MKSPSFRKAKPHEFLMKDGSVHACKDPEYRPLAIFKHQRYYCNKCGVRFEQVEGEEFFLESGHVGIINS